MGDRITTSWLTRIDKEHSVRYDGTGDIDEIVFKVVAIAVDVYGWQPRKWYQFWKPKTFDIEHRAYERYSAKQKAAEIRIEKIMEGLKIEP